MRLQHKYTISPIIYREPTKTSENFFIQPFVNSVNLVQRPSTGAKLTHSQAFTTTKINTKPLIQSTPYLLSQPTQQDNFISFKKPSIPSKKISSGGFSSIRPQTEDALYSKNPKLRLTSAPGHSRHNFLANINSVPFFKISTVEQPIKQEATTEYF